MLVRQAWGSNGLVIYWVCVFWISLLPRDPILRWLAVGSSLWRTWSWVFMSLWTLDWSMTTRLRVLNEILGIPMPPFHLDRCNLQQSSWWFECFQEVIEEQQLIVFRAQGIFMGARQWISRWATTITRLSDFWPSPATLKTGCFLAPIWVYKLGQPPKPSRASQPAPG